ncbi:MAG: hypothetical protein CMJ89_09900 [Planctomycetes bacterium]|jgi:mono/diheme cytochrome c family protein|nr:hypothetical protein [Planctomycetota bacterium]
MIPSTHSKFVRHPLLVVLTFFLGHACSVSPPGGVAAASAVVMPLTKLARGERLYRDGLRADGTPIAAIVAGDIRVQGTQFTCVSCHQKSGMGSSESWLVAPPITPQMLFAPLTQGPHRRPAYTHETLGRAIVEGIDPAGQELEAPMPRYDLSADDLDDLLLYLATLSAEASPGVTPEEIHFATVVAGEVDATPMLEVLDLFVDEKNRNTRNETGRARRGPFHRSNVNESYRRWVLHTWKLGGSPDTWTEQLEEFYERQPVFALLSGITAGQWDSVQSFCEERKLPCLLPNVDLPPEGVSEYTLYYSRGLRLEAARIAEAAGEGARPKIFQVFRKGTPGGMAAQALQTELARRELPPAVGIEIPARRPTSHGDLGDIDLGPLMEAPEPSLVVLWGSPADLTLLANQGIRETGAGIIVSSTLLDGSLSDLPPALVGRARIAHPFRVPVDYARAARRVELWLQHRGIETGTDVGAAHRRVQLQTHFACMLVGDAFMHIKYDDYFRDYVLECIDHMSVIANFCASHPSLSFGPGQRFLSKGCYLLEPDELAAGPKSVGERWRVP